ncbi:unnamed protein product [Phytophthora fragariaefolia]|uniref:Unnamed protein product n=1 Tax=Phytophthora fragariaefolia TaxID=1490495 RepID=A0A9W6Y3H6_9STRA|nr:unnamed protein product [Phytophthora fragariaefolia]
MALESPPTLASALTSLPAMSWKRFARDLHDGHIEQICILSDIERMESEAEELTQLVTEGADALSAKSKKKRFDEQSWDSLKSSPLYEVLREFKDVLPDDNPAELPHDKGVEHEIDLVPGTNAGIKVPAQRAHMSQRMARWLSFFAKYNFQVEYKPGRLNVVADALSRRPDYAVPKADANAIGVVRTSTPSLSLLDDVRSAYANDADAKQLLNYFAVPSDKSPPCPSVSTRARTARSPINESTVSTLGVDTVNINNQHTQAGPVVNKDTELKTEFSSKAMDFVQRRQAVTRLSKTPLQLLSIDRS